MNQGPVYRLCSKNLTFLPIVFGGFKNVWRYEIPDKLFVRPEDLAAGPFFGMVLSLLSRCMPTNDPLIEVPVPFSCKNPSALEDN